MDGNPEFAVFHVKRADAAKPSPFAAAAILEEGRKSMGAPEGMPIVVSSEGWCSLINAFLRQLPTDGCSSPDTWNAYCRDVVALARFLAKRDKDLLTAAAPDLVAFHTERRVARKVDDVVVSVASWNRSVAGIQKFYLWALREDLIASLPFKLRTSWGRATHGGSAGSNRLRERAGSSDEVKCISLDDYLFFRDVGLKGLCPEGTAEGRAGVRNGQRNAAYAELLVNAGPRLREAALILLAELPAIVDDGRTKRDLELGRLTCKGSRGRTLKVHDRVLELLRVYVEEDRANAVARLRRDLSAARDSDDVVVAADFHSRDCVFPDGKKRRYDDMRENARRVLYRETGDGLEPAMLWLTETGRPVDPETFEIAFARASERCQRWRPHLHVTPHTLRHTYAVQMLSLLIRLAIGDLLELRARKAREDEGTYQRLLLNPLGQLRKLLGHRSEITTYRYLTYLETANDAVDEAIASWSAATSGRECKR